MCRRESFESAKPGRSAGSQAAAAPAAAEGAAAAQVNGGKSRLCRKRCSIIRAVRKDSLASSKRCSFMPAGTEEREDPELKNKSQNSEEETITITNCRNFIFLGFRAFLGVCLFSSPSPKYPMLLDATVQECGVTKAHSPKRSETSITWETTWRTQIGCWCGPVFHSEWGGISRPKHAPL